MEIRTLKYEVRELKEHNIEKERKKYPRGTISEIISPLNVNASISDVEGLSDEIKNLWEQLKKITFSIDDELILLKKEFNMFRDPGFYKKL